jgi:predicted DNA-binding transcriptional regulator YafY
MKSGRLLNLLLLLQANNRLTAADLAGRLEVSERTIHRDMDALSSAGIPVYAERGVGGGIRLADGYRKALTQFGDDEIRALFIASANPLADIGLGEGLARALEKLAGALPAPQRRTAERSRSLIFFDPRRWKQAVAPREHLATLRRAIWEDRRIKLGYRDSKREKTVRVAEPLGLVAKAGVWYLVARSKDDMRVFRCDRILTVDVEGGAFERPAGFDLAAFWQSWSTRFEESLATYAVRLHVSPEAIEDVTGYWEVQFTDRGAAPNGWIEARVIFPSVDAALPQLVAWGGGVRLMEPLELRERMVAAARAILAHDDVPATEEAGA